MPHKDKAKLGKKAKGKGIGIDTDAVIKDFQKWGMGPMPSDKLPKEEHAPHAPPPAGPSGRSPDSIGESLRTHKPPKYFMIMPTQGYPKKLGVET
jgi:hypothetical protein